MSSMSEVLRFCTFWSYTALPAAAVGAADGSRPCPTLRDHNLRSCPLCRLRASSSSSIAGRLKALWRRWWGPWRCRSAQCCTQPAQTAAAFCWAGGLLQMSVPCSTRPEQTAATSAGQVGPLTCPCPAVLKISFTVCSISEVVDLE